MLNSNNPRRALKSCLSLIPGVIFLVKGFSADPLIRYQIVLCLLVKRGVISLIDILALVPMDLFIKKCLQQSVWLSALLISDQIVLLLLSYGKSCRLGML